MAVIQFLAQLHQRVVVLVRLVKLLAIMVALVVVHLLAVGLQDHLILVVLEYQGKVMLVVQQ
jgi:hypothetical protein